MSADQRPISLPTSTQVQGKASVVDSLLLLGVDHHRTPIGLRERLAVAADALPLLLRELTALPGAAGAVVLSTCNRSECLVAGTALDAEVVLSLVAQRQGLPLAELRPQAYVHRGAAAVRHLFRVAASLESMVVGEYQILHQVKHAYQAAQQAGTAGGMVHRLCQRALALGKQVRSETGLGRHKLSVASIAVDLAKRIHGELTGVHLLLTGAGEMAELALRHFLEQGVRRVTLVNRNRTRAEELAARLLHEGGGEVQVADWSRLAQSLGAHDIVLSSTAAPHPVIRAEEVRRAMQGRRRPLMLLDLAVPRDVEVAAGAVDDAYLYNVDDLEAVAADNRQLRADEVEAASALIEAGLATFLREEDQAAAAMRQRILAWCESVAAQEAERLAQKPAGASADEIRYAMQRLAGKFQHRLLNYLSAHAGEPAALDALGDIIGDPAPEA